MPKPPDFQSVQGSSGSHTARGSLMAEKRRPAAATAAGIIEISVAGFGVLVYLFPFFSSLSAWGAHLSIGSFFGLAAVFLFLGVSGIGLAGGILLLTNKKTGFVLSIVWSGAGLLGFLLILVFLFLPASLSLIWSPFSLLLGGVALVAIPLAILFVGAPAMTVLLLVVSRKAREFYAGDALEKSV